MKINRFFLGVLILNVLFLKVYFDILIANPKLITVNLAILILIIGIVGLIANCFNAFPKETTMKGGK